MNKKLVAIAGLALLTGARLIMKRNKKRLRRYKVRPMNRNRNSQGTFATLVHDMMAIEHDKKQFFKYVRLSPEMFQALLSLIGPSLLKNKTKNPLSPEHRLIITLHYLAEGCSMQEIAWNFRVGKTTVHKIVKETMGVIWTILVPIFLPKPTINSLRSIETEFLKRWNVPNCVGAIDGKHIIIQAPGHSGSIFFNYKKSSSIVLMAVCDAYYRLVFVDIGSEGSKHDSEVFGQSAFGSLLLKTKLLPPPKELPGTNIKLPHFIIGDSAFPLHQNIMRPYAGDHLSIEKKICNYRLSRGRRTIENTFGIMAQRWRMLRKPIIASEETCREIVQAIVALHNFAQVSEKDLHISERKYCPMGFADHVDEFGNIILGSWRAEGMGSLIGVRRTGANNASQSAKENRDSLAEYFVSPHGSLPWQEDHVLRGSLPRHQ